MVHLGFPWPPSPGAPHPRPRRPRPPRCNHRWRMGYWIATLGSRDWDIAARGRRCERCGCWQERHRWRWVSCPSPRLEQVKFGWELPPKD
jgi:hypothetical protein